MPADRQGGAPGAGSAGPGAPRGESPLSEEGEGPQTITLIDESGMERRFRLHDAFELDGVAYYLVEGADDPSEVMLLRETGGTLETVENEEFQRVMKALEKDEVD